MPINAGPEYFKSEKEYLNAQNLEDKIFWLEEMIRTAPKHKSSENLLAELRVRLKKYKEKAEKGKKKAGGKKGIRKEGFQFLLLGKTNVGKSYLLSKLTRAEPRVGDYPFTTVRAEIGTFEFGGVKAQVIDQASVGSDRFDVGMVNTADCVIVVVRELGELDELDKVLVRARGKKIVVVTKVDLLDSEEIRKEGARMKSKRIDGVMVSAKSGYGMEELKGRMMELMGVIRVYMKEPGKEKSEPPMVLKGGATIKDVGETIRKGFSKTIKEARVTGPSSKFPNQRVGLAHKIKDLDVVEFHTR